LVDRKAPAVRSLPFLSEAHDLGHGDMAALDSTICTREEMTLLVPHAHGLEAIVGNSARLCLFVGATASSSDTSRSQQPEIVKQKAGRSAGLH
jgi:hypothetical protein